MCPKNMPYYCWPWVTSPPSVTSSPAVTPNHADVTYCQTLTSSIITDISDKHRHLSNIPVWFGKFSTVTPHDAHSSTNNKFPYLAQQVLFFNWVVYLFGGGHFILIITSHNLSFQIILACDQVKSGRALFQKFTSSSNVFSNGKELWITHAPLGTCPRFMDTWSTHYDSRIARLLPLFGSSNLRLSPNFDYFKIFNWWWKSSFPITMGTAWNYLFHLLNGVAGQPQCLRCPFLILATVLQGDIWSWWVFTCRAHPLSNLSTWWFHHILPFDPWCINLEAL